MKAFDSGLSFRGLVVLGLCTVLTRIDACSMELELQQDKEQDHKRRLGEP